MLSYFLFSEPVEKQTSDGGKSEIKPSDTDESGLFSLLWRLFIEGYDIVMRKIYGVAVRSVAC